MAKTSNRAVAAKKFAEKWDGSGYEKGQSQTFWLELLQSVYGNLILFPDLMKAHRANDAAVMETYGFRKDMTEPEIVAELFKMYQKLTTK